MTVRVGKRRGRGWGRGGGEDFIMGLVSTLGEGGVDGPGFDLDEGGVDWARFRVWVRAGWMDLVSEFG